MANIFKNAVLNDVGTTSTTLYTVPALTTSTIIGLSLANVTTAQIYVDVFLTDTSGATTVHLGKGLPVPVGSSLVVVGGEHKIVLETGDIIKVQSNTAASCDVVMSVLQIS